MNQDQVSNDWPLIVSHMHFNGNRYRKDLTDEQMWTIYCLADGFGKMTSAELSKINGGWDWSHIRDSSDEAITRMANRIRDMVG